MSQYFVVKRLQTHPHQRAVYFAQEIDMIGSHTCRINFTDKRVGGKKPGFVGGAMQIFEGVVVEIEARIHQQYDVVY